MFLGLDNSTDAFGWFSNDMERKGVVSLHRYFNIRLIGDNESDKAWNAHKNDLVAISSYLQTQERFVTRCIAEAYNYDSNAPRGKSWDLVSAFLSQNLLHVRFGH